MAGEYDEKFDELTGLVRKIAGRVDELQLDMRDLRQGLVKAGDDIGSIRSDIGEIRGELKKTNQRMGSLEGKFDVLSGQFNGIGSMAIDDHKRIDALEKRVDDLEGTTH